MITPKRHNTAEEYPITTLMQHLQHALTPTQRERIHALLFAKRRGWQWHKTQMVDEARAERLRLALAVATLWVVGVGSEVAQRRAACGLGRCVGVSCFRLGRLQMLAAQARGEWCALEGLVGGDWLGERSPPV